MTYVAVDELEPSDGFRAVLALRALADQMEGELVDRAIDLGWSWAMIGEALKKHATRRRGSGD